MTTSTPSGTPAGISHTADPKTTENRLRRAAHRQGLALRKSRRRDPNAISYGTFQIIDPSTNFIVAGDHTGLWDGFGLDLDDVADVLNVSVTE